MRSLAAYASAANEFRDVVGEVLLASAGAIFKHGSDAAGCTDTRNGRRWEGKRDAFPDASESLRDVLLNRRVLLVLALALIPRFEGDEIESGIGALREAQQAEPVDAHDALHASGLANDVLDALGGFGRALQRCRIGQDHSDVEISLVLIGQE